MAVIPTKGNLMASQRSMTLARMGFDLMDRKRNILIREIMGLIDEATELQARIDSTFSAAYQSLQDANIRMGQNPELAETIAVDTSISIRFRSIMGVEIPLVTASETPNTIVSYGFSLTSSSLDQAKQQFEAVKHMTREMAELEISIYRLAVAIKKTQKRANALSNIIIPNFYQDIKSITEALEEKEREEFSRLKVIKSLTQ
jgi:V/A-type H+-transporting ATPase subunit D